MRLRVLASRETFVLRRDPDAIKRSHLDGSAANRRVRIIGNERRRVGAFRKPAVLLELLWCGRSAPSGRFDSIRTADCFNDSSFATTSPRSFPDTPDAAIRFCVMLFHTIEAPAGENWADVTDHLRRSFYSPM